MRNGKRTLLDWLGLSDTPDWRVARPLGPLLSVILALLFIGAVTAAFVALARAISGSEGTTGLGTGALVIGLLGAPFLVWSTVIKHQTLRYQKEGHITDRISRAVEQLGSEKTVKKAGREETVPNIEVRIGAILSLERIAQDSTTHDNGRDHVRVMEILCAYVRENAKAETAEDHPFGEWKPLKEDATAEERKAYDKRARQLGDWAFNLKPPRADVQLALTVIGRRTAEQRRVEAAWPEPPTDSTVWPFDRPFPPAPQSEGDANLPREQNGDLESELSDWAMALRSYSGYRLNLRGANLQSADLSAKRPDASDSVFSGALLDGARMEGVRLNNARIEQAQLSWARMEGARLGNARLMDAFLLGVSLEGAKLDRTRMQDASLFGARLDAALLEKVEMNSRTDLMGATLRGAALRVLNLSEFFLAADQINSAFGDASVTLPEGIARPAHWPVWELPPYYGLHDFDTEWRQWRADPAAYTPPPPPGSD
ncbi:MAG: hypothetical protein CVT80_13895 [Alphaproteobacteria bacterium HGW-Alphaproteobacteria-2]|nr:MAG: hypothetical protein CVT80_13895 [Alphaproteobacteria bacterium HGW-Alphaproteobacteria-2]